MQPAFTYYINYMNINNLVIQDFTNDHSQRALYTIMGFKNQWNGMVEWSKMTWMTQMLDNTTLL